MIMILSNKKTIFLLLFTILTALLSQNELLAKQTKVLLFNGWGWHLPGGGSNHFLYLHKIISRESTLLSSELLSYKDSFIIEEAQRLGLSYQTYKHKPTVDFFIAFCIKHKIDVVTFPTLKHAELFKEVAKKIPLKLIYVHQGSISESIERDIISLKGIDAIVGINLEITNYFILANNKHNLGIRKIVTIPPSWDEERIDLTIKAQPNHQSAIEFFKKRFNIELTPQLPIIATIANMEDPVKNQSLLIKALNIVINKYHKPVYAMLAGDGKLRKLYEQEIAQFGLQKYIHILGPMLDAPALLYYSNIHVLPSYAEGFPVVNLEASYMSKPILAANNTGSNHFIEHNKTGYLFQNNDANDLAQKISVLLDDPTLQIRLSTTAHQLVMNSFINKKLLRQWELLLNEDSL
jgi:glycosyltransferase involved in cell wall biosynthesis